MFLKYCLTKTEFVKMSVITKCHITQSLIYTTDVSELKNKDTKNKISISSEHLFS